MGLFNFIGEQIEKGKEKARQEQRSHEAYHWALAHVPQKVSGTNGVDYREIAESLADPTSGTDYSEQEHQLKH